MQRIRDLILALEREYGIDADRTQDFPLDGYGYRCLRNYLCDGLEERMGMISPSSTQRRYTVLQFMDRNGEVVDTYNEATMVICEEEGCGLAMPFSKEVLGAGVKIGDTFTETRVINHNM